MTGLHFRRYELKPDAMPDFLDWWRQIRPVRERHGFRLMFAVYLPEPNEFVSAWSYAGQLDDLERRYYSDPDRRCLAEAARAWAATHARERGEDADRVTAANPGFTTTTHVTEGALVALTPALPGSLTCTAECAIFKVSQG